MKAEAKDPRLLALATGAVGVVYGDVGTSPLYTIKEVFDPKHGIPLAHGDVLGILSLIFWALMVVISLKYVMFIMRADNRGEGGIMALMALAVRTSPKGPHWKWLMTILGLFGASLFYGDGVVTPAISVLSAIEGLEVAAPHLEHYVVPLSAGVLLGLFLFQRRGTGAVGKLFGPIMVVWFLTLGVLGLSGILAAPAVLEAVDPALGIGFFLRHKWHGFLALGAVVLAVTGAEALYADMGHFGKKPIQAAWFCFVLPALLLNYFGQGALLVKSPAAAQNPFYLLAPSWLLLPLIVLSTAATVIASQAVISGAFSLSAQAMQLGYAPRLHTVHTSERASGQIYLPWINWILFLGVLSLVLAFRSSSNLAAAYGMAVTGTMVITTVLAFVVVRSAWNWSWAKVGLVIAPFFAVDLAFFGSNLVKLFEGGWFPLALGAVVFTLMSTWKRGRDLLLQRLSSDTVPLEPFLASVAADPPLRVPGTAVFLTRKLDTVPHALLHNLAHNKVLHERVVLLTVLTEDIPRIPEQDRVDVRPLTGHCQRITVRYGFMEKPDLPEALATCRRYGLDFNLMETSFFLSRETLVPTSRPGMALWREKLFAAMARNAASATAFFGIPANRVVELGTRIEL